MNFSWLVQFVELRSHCATDESILLPEGKIAHFLQQQSASASPEPAILYRKLPLDVSGRRVWGLEWGAPMVGGMLT